MKRDDGGPAFPRHVVTMDGMGGYETPPAEDGMTLRDWFAGQALASMAPVVCKPGCQYEPQDGDPRSVEEFTAAVVYSLADAMLAERAKVERGQAPDPPAAVVLDTVAAQPAPASCGFEAFGEPCNLPRGHEGAHVSPAPVPHCKKCGLILGSDRPYCDVCGCPAVCAEGEIRCRNRKGHSGDHRNGGVSWGGSS